MTVFLLLFDLLRFLSIIFLMFEKCCCCFGGCSPFWSVQLEKQNTGDYKLDKPYAKLVLITQIGLVFLFVAPIVPVVVLVFVATAYPIWARLLHHGIQRPVVDTAGMLWEQAIVYQGYSLSLSQLLLAGVLLKKQIFAGGALIVLLFFFSIFRQLQMRRTWGGAAPTTSHAALDFTIPIHAKQVYPIPIMT